MMPSRENLSIAVPLSLRRVEAPLLSGLRLSW